MNKLPELSRSEWVIMKACWQKEKATARNIYEQTYLKKKWEYQTVKTMLDRLVKKGYLQREKFGPVYIYQCTVPRNQVIFEAVDNFITHTLDSTVMPLFAHFVKEKKLSSEDICSMKKLIEEYEEEQNNDSNH